MKPNPKAPAQSRRRAATLLVALSACVALAASALVAGSHAGLAQDLPSLKIAGAAAAEEDARLIFKVVLDSAGDADVTVDYAVEASASGAGRATGGDSCGEDDVDFAPAVVPQTLSGTLTFAAGETSQTIEFEPCLDGIDEPIETFVLRLSNPSGATLAVADATGTILDHDEAPVLRFAAGEVTAGESDGSIEVVAFLNAASGRAITVDYETVNGSAVAGEDYKAQAGVLTFNPGEEEKEISVEILDDARREDDLESFTVVLSEATHAVLLEEGARTTGTIYDDDDLPTLSITGGSAREDTTERNRADGVVFSVRLDPVSGRDVTVTYHDRPGTAEDHVDYVRTYGTLTIPAGQRAATIVVPVLNDTLPEGDETLRMDLENAVGALTDPLEWSAVGTINDDNDPERDVSVDNGAYNEDEGSVSFRVALSQSTAETVTVNYRTVDGTAKAGASGDYEAVSGTLEFEPNDPVEFISVPLLDDELREGDETFKLQLSAPSGVSAPPDAATALIIDDEPVPCVVVEETLEAYEALDVTEGDGQVDFTVTLESASTRPVTVRYATVDGPATLPVRPATAGLDYVATSGVLRFKPGETTKPVRVPVIDDETDEADYERFTLELSAADGATICKDSAYAQIADNDDLPRVNVNDPEAREGDGVAVFEVSMDRPGSREVTVTYETSEGTANPGADYRDRTGGLTFYPGETLKTVEVALLGDFEDEGGETFTLTLSSPVNAALGDDTGVATIKEGTSRRRPSPPAPPSPPSPPPAPPRSTDPPSVGGSTAVITPGAPPSSAPRIGTILSDVSIRIGDAPVELDLSAAVLGTVDVYRALSSDPSVVTPVVSGARLTLIPVALGAATVSIGANNRYGSVYQSFVVTVREAAPSIASFFPDLVLAVGDPPLTIDAAERFDGAVTSYEARANAPSVLAATVVGSELVLTGRSAGTATVTVVARSTAGSALQQFRVVVESP